MPYETRDNSGTLFRNDRATSDRHPTHKGQATIGGVEYWVSGWTKEAGPTAKNPGSRFFSLAFEPKERQDIQFGNEGHSQPNGAHGGTANGSGQATATDFDDDIPF